MSSETTTNAKYLTEPLTLGTWLLFLVGQRKAILSVAASREALWVGLIMTLSAGFAREYDGAYLWREPWHFVVPVLASVLTSALLYAIIRFCESPASNRDGPAYAGYRQVLTFFWLTAPLAWIYAIPVERFMTPANATRANLAFLGIVSVWRVLLIARALSVWLGARFFRMLWIVLFFGDTVLLILNFITPTPIWDIMGGIRLSEREQVVLEVKQFVWVVGIIAWIVLAIGTAVLTLKSKRTLAERLETGVSRVGWSLWAFGVLLLAVGFVIVPLGLPEQRNRWNAERLLYEGDLASAVRYIAERPREAFPPHWDPPPRTAYGESKPEIIRLLAALRAGGAPEWLYQTYIEKLLSRYDGLSEAIAAAQDGDDEMLSEMLTIFQREPPRGEFRYRLLEQLGEGLKSGTLPSEVARRVREFRATLKGNGESKDVDLDAESDTDAAPKSASSMEISNQTGLTPPQ